MKSSEMSFDAWVLLYGCAYCRKAIKKNFVTMSGTFCMICKHQWLIDMYYADEDRKIIDSIEEEG